MIYNAQSHLLMLLQCEIKQKNFKKIASVTTPYGFSFLEHQTLKDRGGSILGKFKWLMSVSAMLITISLMLVSCNSQPITQSSESNQIIDTPKENLIESSKPNEPNFPKTSDFLKAKIQKITDNAPVDGVLIGDTIWSVDFDGSVNSFDLKTNNNKTHSTGSNRYTSISFDKDHIWFYYSLLLGSSEIQNDVPLLRYDRATQKFYGYSDSFLKVGSNLAVYSDGTTVWIGSESETGVLDLKTNTIKKDKRLGENVRSIVGNDRYVWFGTLSDGVYELDKESGQIRVFNTSNNLKEDFISELILSDNSLMVNWGGEGVVAGISVLDLSSRHWRHFVGVVDDDYDSKILSDKDIDEGFRGFNGFVFIDRLGSVWAESNQENGDIVLNVLLRDSLAWQPFHKPDDFNYPESIDKNHLLMASKQGIIEFNLAENKYEYLLQASNEQFGNIYSLNDSEFLITSTNGLYKLSFI